MLLEKISNPNDIKGLTRKETQILAKEIREFLVQKISATGGHLASNLGVVELTIALFQVLDLPTDKIIWDVGHQAYTHKILSGRKDDFDELRKLGGISGFPKRKESPFDSFDTGHSSTSISAGVGMVQGRDLLGDTYKVVSVIGDGALTGGMAFEALNNAAHLKKNFIIILNDNNMSISENVGGVSKYLSGMRSAQPYQVLKKQVSQKLSGIPYVGTGLVDTISKTKNSIKQFLIPGMLFENMGITYLGPVDGHDTESMKRILKEAMKLEQPVLIHVLTKKGKGYRPAERYPHRFHGVEPFDVKTGKPLKKKALPSYTDVFASAMIEIGRANEKVVGITAAMPDGTGLSKFAKEFPNRFFDVGIAEQHAVTSAAGMAAAGLKPVVAVYSSFLQRGFDQILHDVCIQNLSVVFAIDRAGLVGSDGETHQGIFDISFLSCIPNMTILAPKNKWELVSMLDYAINEHDGPIAIRYPRGTAYDELESFNQPIQYGVGEALIQGSKIAILAVGSMVSTAMHVRDKLNKYGFDCTVCNGRFLKPIDENLVQKLSCEHELLITMEENVCQGGFGLLAGTLAKQHNKEIKLLNITLPDMYVEHGNVSLLREELEIDSDSIVKKVKSIYGIEG